MPFCDTRRKTVQLTPYHYASSPNPIEGEEILTEVCQPYRPRGKARARKIRNPGYL